MGTAQSEDELLFTEDDELFWIDLDKTCSGRFFIVRSSSPTRAEVHVLDLLAKASDKAQLKVIQPREADHRSTTFIAVPKSFSLESLTVGRQFSVLNHRSINTATPIIHRRPSPLYPQHSILNHQPITTQPSAFNPQPSTYHPSTLSIQSSTLNSAPCSSGGSTSLPSGHGCNF